MSQDKIVTRRNDELDAEAAEAQSLGLSYGVYKAYKDSGYLDKYKAQKHPTHDGKVAALGGCGVKHRSLKASKLC